MMHPVYPNDMHIESHNISETFPQDEQGQLSCAFRMIENVFSTASHAYEAEREELKSQNETLKLQNTKLAQTNREQEAHKMEMHQKMRSQGEENRKLVDSYDRLFKRCRALESFQTAILSATTHVSTGDDCYMDLAQIAPQALQGK
eukprot:GHVH01001368.1.p1 GENE.GHVH01001368.1~~GHVH01001368.1.p1  ORF type:complete len:146 (+),score=15.60 GHVH01001368.1:22-459(+)